MKRILFAIIAITFISGCSSQNTAEEKEVVREVEIEKVENMDKKLLRHVVLFKFKDGTAEEDIVKVEKAFSALKDKIPQIKGYEWGTNNSPEGLNKGLTHCFFVTFESEEDREIYLPHPDHKAFVEVLGPHLDDVVVVDYWTNYH